MVLVQRKLIFTIFWGQGDWYQQEVEAHRHIHTDTCDLFSSVFKNELKRERLPLLTNNHLVRESDRFFTSESTGKIHKFNWRGLLEHEKIHGSNISGIYQCLHQRRKPTGELLNNQHSEKFIQMLVATAHKVDDELAITLATHVQGDRLSVQSYFPKNYSTLALIQHIVLLLWSATKGTNLQLLLSRLILSAQTICLHPSGGNEAAKRRFCQKNILLKKIDTFPNIWLETRKLLLSRTGDEP
jgi:hypothetical protein